MWQSAQRLAEYTAWSGHNTATVTVATQGGAIYPSRIWNPTHKFDSGTFLSDGASTDIKDWVELMCCQFDQRGLKLILALDIEGPLAELERVDAEETPSTAIESRYQVDIEGRLAKASADQSSPEARRSTLYNPLDVRVQGALTRIVNEVVERYGKHASFGGVQINLSERSHFNFAGDAWGYDADSLSRFERNLGSALPKDADQRQRLLRGPLRLNFLNDRAEQLTAFYAKLAKEVAARKPDALLIINPTKLVAVPPASENYLLAASQSLSASDLLMASGIDSKAVSRIAHAIALRPEADSPLRVPTSRAWSYRLSADPQMDTLFAGEPSGAMVQQLPTSFRLPEYDKLNPYGNGKSRTWLFPHALSAGDAARRSLSQRLFHADLQHLAVGGWLAPIGQEDAVRAWLLAYQQFPAATMRDLTPSGVSPTLRVRRLEHAGKTYIQLVNDASWNETVVVQFKCAAQTRVVSFGNPSAGDNQVDLAKTEIVARPNQAENVQLSLAAFGLVRCLL